MHILKYFDPTYWFGSVKYANFWQHAFHTFLYGAGAKFMSVSFLLLGFWLLARRENIGGFIFSVLASFFFAYTGGILHLFGF